MSDAELKRVKDALIYGREEIHTILSLSDTERHRDSISALLRVDRALATAFDDQETDQ